jgi:type IV pilus assembly protein PilE
MRQTNGFTLIELLIVIAIIGILAAVALPAYNDYIIRSKFTEAHGQLADLRVKMEQYFMDHRRYSSDATGTACGAAMPPATSVKYFTYSCTAPTAQTYTVTATGVAAQGLAGLSFTVDHGNTKATEVQSGSVIAGKGYQANTGCWIRRKPSDC